MFKKMDLKQNINNIAFNSIEIDMLYRKCFVFVLELIEYTELLEKNKKYSVAKQLLKTGIALGANMNEIKNTDEKKGINKKTKKFMEEVEKTKYWLKICKFSQNYPKPNNLINDIEKISELIANK